MKKTKLTLDKVNVVRLDATFQISGGERTPPIAAPGVVEIVGPYGNSGSRRNENAVRLPLGKRQSISTKRTGRSSLQCFGG